LALPSLCRRSVVDSPCRDRARPLPSPPALHWVNHRLHAFCLAAVSSGGRRRRRSAWTAPRLHLRRPLFGAPRWAAAVARYGGKLNRGPCCASVGAALLLACSRALIARLSYNERGQRHRPPGRLLLHSPPPSVRFWAAGSSITCRGIPIFFINPALCLAALLGKKIFSPCAICRKLDRNASLPASDWLGACWRSQAWPHGLRLDRAPARYGAHDHKRRLWPAGAVVLAIFVGNVMSMPATQDAARPLRSATFSGVNAPDAPAYGARGGAFFLLPFALISVHGYSAPWPAPFPALHRHRAGCRAGRGACSIGVCARFPLFGGPVLIPRASGLFLSWAARRPLCDAFRCRSVVASAWQVTVAPLTST